jgi:hypothetical protein
MLRLPEAGQALPDSLLIPDSSAKQAMSVARVSSVHL